MDKNVYMLDSQYYLDSILPLEHQLSFVLGESGSGKTSFVKNLMLHLSEGIHVQIFCQDLKEWAEYEGVSIENPVAHLELIDKVPQNTIVILDDYFHTQKDVENFSSIINYKLRHQKLTMICMIHTIFKTHIFSSFMLCNNFFFTYSKITKKILQHFFMQYGVDFREAFETHYKEGQEGFHTAYLNLKNMYFIPEVNFLFSRKKFPLTMFKKDEEFLIFPKAEMEIEEIEEESKEQDSSSTSETFERVMDLTREIYPKKNTKILVLAKTLFGYLEKYINPLNFCIETDKFEVNFYDLLRYLNAPNLKKKKNDRDMKRLLHFLQELQMKVPKLLIRNKAAFKFVC